MPEVVVHLGVIWVYEMTPCGWFRYIKAFPEAVKKIKVLKKGKKVDDWVPDPEHESVLKFLKEKCG